MADLRPDPRRPDRSGDQLAGTGGAHRHRAGEPLCAGVEREQITIAPDFAPADAQPAWRQDFPIDWPQDLYVERRDFMKFLVLTSARVHAGPGLDRPAELVPEAQRPAAGAADCLGRRSGRRRPSASPIRTSTNPVCSCGWRASEFVAFSQKCTHLSCAVIPRPAEGSFYCPCHEGRSISGPARRLPARRAGR